MYYGGKNRIIICVYEQYDEENIRRYQIQEKATLCHFDYINTIEPFCFRLSFAQLFPHKAVTVAKPIHFTFNWGPHSPSRQF